MKKSLLILILAFLSNASFIFGQCVPTCSNYVTLPISHSVFPQGPPIANSSFTNPVSGSVPGDDGSVSAIPIGFNFDFYCSSYNMVHICTNGFIMLDYMAFPSAQYVHNTQNIPNSTTPNGMIAFNMTDLDPRFSGTISYTTVGVSPNQMFIVTYSDVPCFSNSNPNTGQIVLYESSNIIEIHTGSAYPDPNQTLGSTQGIENTLGTVATPAPGRNGNNTWGGSPAALTAYRFLPYTPAPPTAITGNTLLCEGTSEFYQATFMTGSTSYSWALPTGWTGTSTLSSITATAGTSGNMSVTATYSCGVSDPTIITLSVNPSPTAGITSVTPNVICSGKTVTLNLTGGVNYTVNPGFITGVSPLTDTPNMNITYTVTTEDALGCLSINNPTSYVLVKQTPSITVNSGSICLGAMFTMTPQGANNYTFSNGFSAVQPIAAGDYVYTVTGTYGGTNNCVSDPVTSSLTVYALPTLTASASRTSICAKESVVLTAGGVTTYTWNNNQTSTFTIALNASTVFVVNGKDANGCPGSATVNVTVKPCTGIDENIDSGFGLEVFPNPSNGQITIRSELFGDRVFVEIYNSIGQLIKSEKMVSSAVNLDLQSLHSGLYYIKLREADRQQVVRLVKE
ncbi:MAG: T9SS type A sorting domain-containing protein [Bacteroidia bacterium]|nr:T9SS type A sorting domain-containing protein [Bacteroidia bacterium]